MDTIWHQRAVALAGLFQAIELIDELATTGYLRRKEYTLALESLLVTSPNNTLEVYGGSASNLKHGLEHLLNVFQHTAKTKHRMSLNYAVAINNLTKSLLKRSDMLNTLSNRIDEAREKIEIFGIDHDNVTANIAETYSATLSTFQYRIQVRGDASYLQQTRVASQIRALLLCAVRATILWRQQKGNALQLILNKRKLLSAAEELLQETKKVL